jgi:putative pyruvate formate lyase activating enzyme
MRTDKLDRIKYFLEKHQENIRSCRMCPRACGVDRAKELGECGEGFDPRISSANLHYGEEPPISGTSGSGTIFFTGCNLHCLYCQNFPISQLHRATKTLGTESLADTMLALQKRGAHNINFVTPSHYVYQAVAALGAAVEKGLTIPVVYNTSGYDSLPVIRDLEGIVDIYLPDMKYVFDDIAVEYSCAPDYPRINRSVLLEMYRQTGLEIDADDAGIAKRGLIIRHLVIPGNVENSKEVLKWIAENLSPDIHLALMSQYFPADRAANHPVIGRRLTQEEYDEVIGYADGLGFENGWFQELEAHGGC